jgi:hypothetical protein
VVLLPTNGASRNHRLTYIIMQYYALKHIQSLSLA